jgi:hypothetical protein
MLASMTVFLCKSNTKYLIHSISTIDIFLYGLQPSPEMGFFVRFDGIKRIQVQLRKRVKELVKIESSFPHRKMFIHLSMIIMEVNLTQEPS